MMETMTMILARTSLARIVTVMGFVNTVQCAYKAPVFSAKRLARQFVTPLNLARRTSMIGMVIVYPVATTTVATIVQQVRNAISTDATILLRQITFGKAWRVIQRVVYWWLIRGNRHLPLAHFHQMIILLRLLQITTITTTPVRHPRLLDPIIRTESIIPQPLHSLLLVPWFLLVSWLGSSGYGNDLDIGYLLFWKGWCRQLSRPHQHLFPTQHHLLSDQQ